MAEEKVVEGGVDQEGPRTQRDPQLRRLYVQIAVAGVCSVPRERESHLHLDVAQGENEDFCPFCLCIFVLVKWTFARLVVISEVCRREDVAVAPHFGLECLGVEQHVARCWGSHGPGFLGQL